MIRQLRIQGLQYPRHLPRKQRNNSQKHAVPIRSCSTPCCCSTSENKRPLPFYFSTIGLITGRGYARPRRTYGDLQVAAGRWPAVRFGRNTAVQGPSAVAQIVEALAELDAHPGVDVIVIARGGAGVEDLLPFSDGTLCRAIAVAPLRWSAPSATNRTARSTIWSPTCAPPLRPTRPRKWCPTSPKRPHRPAAAAATGRCTTGGPPAAHPVPAVQPTRAGRSTANGHRSHRRGRRARAAGRRDIRRLVAVQSERVGHLAARLATLGPAATLARGYAVVQVLDGSATVLRSTADRRPGQRCASRLSDGGGRCQFRARGGCSRMSESMTPGQRTGLRTVPR